MGSFDRYEALSFDCYGTLIDWDAGIGSQLTAWAADTGIPATRDELLMAFSGIESVVQRERTPALLYPEVLAETLRRMGRSFGVTTSDTWAERFGASVPLWPAFADSHGALVRLAERFRLIVVSNIDRNSFEASKQRLGVSFDAVITAEDVGSYKPRDGHFVRLLETLDDMEIDRNALLHVAESLFHDHEPAARHGIDSVWIDRHAGSGHGATAPPTHPAVEPRWRYESMAEFVEAVNSP